MKKVEIQNSLVDFISSDLLDLPSKIDPEETFENLSLGSIEIMEIIFFIEKEYKFKLDGEVFREGRLKSVKSLSEYTAHEMNFRLGSSLK